MNQYKIEYSYVNNSNKRIYETDVFVALSVDKAIKKLRERYEDFEGLCIVDVWEEQEDQWSHVNRFYWEE